MVRLVGYSGETVQEKRHMLRHPGTNPPPFEAHVLGTSESSLFLSESHCYPRGGGQPGDTGQISHNDGRTSPFFEVLPGELIDHPVEDPSVFDVGESILCSIDPDRRNAHALMHTSQHIFSALAEDIWGAETVGNQIGMEQSRVDLLFEDKTVFDPEVLVDAVNSVIDSAIPVNVHEWDRDTITNHKDMRHMKFMDRIPSSVTHLRVVEIEGVDLCPCAGTHVANTREIHPVSFNGLRNKGKGRLRVSYTLNRN